MLNNAEMGSVGVIKQVEMPETTKTVLLEILAQNRMILEVNCQTMRLIGQPVVFVEKSDAVDG